MAIKGDFISFTYNGVHSTELGVMRVTSSNRYTDALLPTIQDKTVQAPGSNGTYFFGSYYTQRQITISVAFDEVTEDQIRLMRKTFGDQLSHQLTFDDEPYKVYYAKTTGTPQLQYVPFSSPRVYKGEGTFTFTCYEPFAHTPNNYKYLNQYIIFRYRQEDFEQGNISASGSSEIVPTDGQNTDNNKLYRIRSKGYEGYNYRSIVLNTNFNAYRIFSYDVDKECIGKSSWLSSGTEYQTPEGIKYIRIVLANTSDSSPTGDSNKVTVEDFKYTYIKPSNAAPWYWYNNRNEWNLGANLLDYQVDSTYDVYNTGTHQFKIYNPGDVETDFKLIIKFPTNGSSFSMSGIHAYNDNTNENRALNVSINGKKGSDVSIQFSSKTNLIEGLDAQGARTGNLYNDKIASGSWFKLPITTDGHWYFQINDFTSYWNPSLEYDYLYF